MRLENSSLIWLKAFSLLFLFVIIGSINNKIIYNLPINEIWSAATSLFLFGIYILGFLLILNYSHDIKFIKNTLFAFISPIIFAPFILFPNLANQLGFISPTHMFEGFFKGDTTSFAMLLLIPFIILITHLLKTSSWKRKLVYAFLVTLNASLILWTGTRSAWFAASISAIIILLFTFKREKHLISSKFAHFTLYASIYASIAMAAFLLLPHYTQISVLGRVFPQITDYSFSQEIIQNTSLSKALAKIKANPKPSFPYQNRDSIWPQAFKLLVENPTGLGPNYHISSKAILQDGQITVAHNLFLEAGLQGGVGALTIYILLIGKTIVSLLKAAKKNTEWIILGAALLSLLIISFVDGHYLSPILFIYALALSLEQKKPPS